MESTDELRSASDRFLYQYDTAMRELPPLALARYLGRLIDSAEAYLGEILHKAIVSGADLKWFAQEAYLHSERVHEAWLSFAIRHAGGPSALPIEELHQASQRIYSEREFLIALRDLKVVLAPEAIVYVMKALGVLIERGDLPSAE